MSASIVRIKLTEDDKKNDDDDDDEQKTFASAKGFNRRASINCAWFIAAIHCLTKRKKHISMNEWFYVG